MPPRTEMAASPARGWLAIPLLEVTPDTSSALWNAARLLPLSPLLRQLVAERAYQSQYSQY
jgi:hypothetical protein